MQARHLASLVPLRRALEIRPDYPETALQPGRVATGAGRSRGGDCQLERSATPTPALACAPRCAWETLAAQGRAADAVAAGNAAVQLDPESTEAWEALGASLHAE